MEESKTAEEKALSSSPARSQRSRESYWEPTAYRTLYFACRSMPTKVAHG